MVKRFILGILLALAALFLAFFAGGAQLYMRILFDLSSLLLIIVMPFAGLLMSYPPREMGVIFRQVFAGHVDREADYGAGILFFKAWQNYLLLTGVIIFLTGLIAMLAHLMDRASIGRGVSQALLITLYAAALNLLFVLPCKASLMRKQSEQQVHDGHEA